VEPPPSAIEKRTSPPRAWRGLEIANRFPTSAPMEEPVIVELVPPSGDPMEDIEIDPASDPGPPALRGEELARALAALK
jgi:hypothetical protein